MGGINALHHMARVYGACAFLCYITSTKLYCKNFCFLPCFHSHISNHAHVGHKCKAPHTEMIHILPRAANLNPHTFVLIFANMRM